MAINWSIIDGNHVRKACQLYGKTVPKNRKSKNTFLVWDGEKYDAKFIRGMAYQIASKTKLDHNIEYSGGMETVNFFTSRGFAVKYNGKLIRPKAKDEIEDGVAGISMLYSQLQDDYSAWSENFNSYRGVINWLKKNNIKKTVEKQNNGVFLFDPHWNCITVPVLRVQAKNHQNNRMANIKSIIHEMSEKLSEKDLNYFWYLLYFIHPGRHELYYPGHFKNDNDKKPHYRDYSSRMTWLLRSHRQGLKGLLKSFQSGSAKNLNDSYVKGCATSFSKHLHIHPTSWKWKRPSKFDVKNIKAKIKSLPYNNGFKGNGPLTSMEKECVVALSQMGNRSFNKWIYYSPCAINSGPRFRLRPGKKLTHCFNEIVEILAKGNISQSHLMEKLREYHTIKTF